MKGLKKGYKNTEVGVIPEDWNIKNIGEIFSFYSTASYSRAQMYFENEYACIHYGDIHTRFNNFINLDKATLPCVTEKQARPYVPLENGDLIIADASEDYEGVGKSIEIINTNKKAIAGLHTLLLRDREKLFINGYKGYIFHNINVKRSLDRIATGLKVYSLSKGSLIDILLPIPLKQEQQAIAEALSDIDALINALNKQLEKKKNIKQGAMQELLTGKRRLEGFTEEWRFVKLGEITKSINTGKRNNENQSINGAYPFFVRSQNVCYINSYSFDGEAILIPGEGGIGAIIHYINGKFDYHQRVYKISNFISSNCKFIYYNMMQFFGDYANKNSVKATVDSLRLPTFLEYELLIPPTQKEQSAIAQILTDMDNEIEQLEKKRDKYLNIKSGMMQQLLTGQIRLK